MTAFCPITRNNLYNLDLQSDNTRLYLARHVVDVFRMISEAAASIIMIAYEQRSIEKPPGRERYRIVITAVMF